MVISFVSMPLPHHAFILRQGGAEKNYINAQFWGFGKKGGPEIKKAPARLLAGAL
jgi:hypothetical protein